MFVGSDFRVTGLQCLTHYHTQQIYATLECESHRKSISHTSTNNTID